MAVVVDKTIFKVVDSNGRYSLALNIVIIVPIWNIVYTK